MKININKDGIMLVYVNNSVEYFAIKSWIDSLDMHNGDISWAIEILESETFDDSEPLD